MIDVYYWPTPNGKKVTILLEECDLGNTIADMISYSWCAGWKGQG